MSGVHAAAALAADALRAGREAWAAALRALDDSGTVSEDQPLDPALLAQALEQFQLAAAGFARAGSQTMEAQALLGGAEVLLRMATDASGGLEQLWQAEQCARGALERLDCVRDLEPALRGYLLLAAISRQLIPTLPPEQREPRLRGLTAVLESAQYLAQEHGDLDLLALAKVHACHVLSERFEPDRDENLLDAIRHGERACARLRELPGARSFELPALLHQLGNCCMKVGGDRSRWLRQGRGWYREGAEAVDARRYPRLHRLLTEHVAMAEALLAEQHYSLPEKEMVARYGSHIQTALRKQEGAEARKLAWGFLAWAWSLPQTPNVHVGEAHQRLAKVAISRGDVEEAQHHLYHSVGVLSAVLAETDRWYYLVGEARDLYAQVLRHAGQEVEVELWLGRAAQAFATAQAATARAAQVIDRDPAASLPDLDYALAAFPCHPTAHFYRGVVRMLQGDLAGAATDFDFTITLKPKSLRAHVNRANVKMKLGDLEGAKADLDHAVELEPHNVDVLRTRAWLHQQRGDHDQAVADLEAALSHATDPQLRATLEQQIAALP